MRSSHPRQKTEHMVPGIRPPTDIESTDSSNFCDPGHPLVILHPHLRSCHRALTATTAPAPVPVPAPAAAARLGRKAATSTRWKISPISITPPPNKILYSSLVPNQTDHQQKRWFVQFYAHFLSRLNAPFSDAFSPNICAPQKAGTILHAGDAALFQLFASKFI